jgi:hypothetical protein
MKPEPDIRNLSDAERFELLEHPERWPEDPALQAEFAELLELHLGLQAHGPSVAEELKPLRGISRLQGNWLLAAAALLMALVPTVYAVSYGRRQAALAKERAHVVAAANQRGQERLWADFFKQSADLLREFQENPKVCVGQEDREDLSQERLVAQSLLQASHQLTAQGNPVQGADAFRASFHAWLTELTLEDGCLPPERVKELQDFAQAHNLAGEAERLHRLLQKEKS